MGHTLKRASILSMLVAIAFACSSQSPTNGATAEQAAAPDCDADADCESYYRCIDGECMVPPAMTGEHSDDTPVVHLHDDAGELLTSFHLELAVTEEEQARGLMYRPEMLDEWGMLFIYEQEHHLSFWMKNTLIPLDMIFIDNTGTVVGVVPEAEPETQTPRRVAAPARYVLEINGGLAEEFGIAGGATMNLENVDASHQPDHQ